MTLGHFCRSAHSIVFGTSTLSRPATSAATLYKRMAGRTRSPRTVARALVAPQWNNVAFDLLLSAFGKIFNTAVGRNNWRFPYVAIFFWGRIRPWSVQPLGARPCS